MSYNINKFRGDGDEVALDQEGTSAQARFNISCAGASAANAASAINGTYWTFSTNRNDYYVWYNITGTASAGTVLSVADPTPEAGRIGIPISMTVAEVQESSTIAAATVAQLSKLSEVNAVASTLGFRVTMREFGPVGVAIVSSTFVGTGVSPSVILSGASSGGTEASNLLGAVRPVVDVVKVILASNGLATAVIDAAGSVYDLDGSTYRVVDINKGMQGDGSSFTIVASAGDTEVKSNNAVYTHTQRGSIGSSSLGGVV